MTGVDGKYTVAGLFAGYAYEVRPVPATLPAGWLMGTDPGDLAVTLSGAPGQNVVNVGYFNPFAPSPLRQSDWKKELKQAGKPRYTTTQVEGVHCHRRGGFEGVCRGGGHPRGPDEVTDQWRIWAMRSRSTPRCG